MDMSVTGGCLCGAVRYRVSGAPVSSSICHCGTCRRASGAPSVAWFVVPRDRFELLSGELSTFPSSTPVIRQFCAVCGSQLIYRHDDNPDLVEITTATLDDPEVFPPTREIWLSHKLSWEVTNPERRHESDES